MNIDNLIKQKKKELEFITHNESYFGNHGFYDVPNELVSRKEVFANCSMFTSVWPISTASKKVVDDATKPMYCILTQPLFLLADTFYSVVDSGIDLKFLFGENSDIPDCDLVVDCI